MGLTIHYQLSTESDWTEEEVFARWEILRDYARHLRCDSVGAVEPAYQMPEITAKRHKVGRGYNVRHVAINACSGWCMRVDVGEGCEPFMLALCRYPGVWRCQHGHSMRRLHPTKISSDWQFSWFCKTQFAGRHGAGHFIRCHRMVVSLLDFCQKAGLNVTVKDEAGYWEKRDDEELQEKLRSSEAMLAAFGGFLKDMTGQQGRRRIQSPIFDYANFEHLEHEGWLRYGKVLGPLTAKKLPCE